VGDRAPLDLIEGSTEKANKKTDELQITAIVTNFVYSYKTDMGQYILQSSMKSL
jgi:hypothetical protein